jgi:predicted TIM-barrel fold metal-dependent hydrolase
VTRTTAYPSLIAGLASDEYRPVRPARAELLAREELAKILATERFDDDVKVHEYVSSRAATAKVLRTFDAYAGGGFFAIPEDAAHDERSAAEAFGRGADPFVIDVQTHLVSTPRWAGRAAESLTGFLKLVDPQRWEGGVDPQLLCAARWATHMFGESDTNIALITSLPGRSHENVLTNDEIASYRDLVDRYTGTKRVLTHTIVHPNLGPEEINRVPAWSETLRPAGWKVYTLWDPPERIPAGGTARGWFLDDEDVGIPFLETVRSCGPPIVCAHKGIAGPIPEASPPGSSPRDIGPAAHRYPDLTFVVYHSGYEIDPVGEEGPYRDADARRGVNRLVASLNEHGILPGSNVYAELGSTWYLTLRRPREAAHVIGKLLRAVGEDRILWGTDSIWYGSPQPLIDSFWSFQIPEEMQVEFDYPPLTEEAKTKILWRNAADLYGVSRKDLSRAVSPVGVSDLRRLRESLT